MRMRRAAAGFALMLVVAGCGGSSEGAADAPKMPDVVGKQLDVAVADIASAGIEDEPEIVGGGTFGVIDESNWKVCEQSPAADEDVTTAPELTVDRSCGDVVSETTAPTTETTVVSSEPPAAAPEEILTAETSPELAALLTEPNECSDTVQAFAFNNGGRTIEFDGNIAALANHGSYDTRFDILVYAGDLNPSTARGPSFQFRDVSIVSDLNLSGPNIPDSLAEGDNLRIVAKVEGFEEGSCLFLLDPVSTSVR